MTREVAQNASLDFAPELGRQEQSVTVSADASTLPKAQSGWPVGQQMVENLPLNGRPFQQLITLAPE